MHLRRISSAFTFPYKYLLPIGYVLGFLSFLVWGLPFPTGDRVAMWVFPLAVAAAVLTTIGFWPIKRVLIDENSKLLYVSNYRREIAIPFSEIADVTEFKWNDPRRITIHLRNESEFGKKIVFLGTYRFGGAWAGSHPVVKELQNLALDDPPLRIPKLGPRF